MGVGAGIEEKWPVLARHERAAEWLRIWADLGRAPRTIDAYARGLAEYLQACERDGTDPLTATRAQVAGFVRELRTRPGRRGGNVVALDSGARLSNATLQQRLVPVRLFYDFLIEEGCVSPTLSAGAASPPAGASAPTSAACSRTTRSCRGSPAMHSGGRSCEPRERSRPATE